MSFGEGDLHVEVDRLRRELETRAGTVDSPEHYRGNGVETMDAMASMMYGADVTNMQAYWWGNALKYIWRWPRKNGTEDLRKAIRCIEYLIAESEECDG